MEPNQNSVWFIVLGAFLAFITTLVVEFFKNFYNQKQLRKNFKTVLKLEFKHCISIIDKLNEDYGNKTFFSFGIIDQLDKNLQRLEYIRKDTIYLKEDTKKEEILTCINDLFVIASDIRSNENFAFKNDENETPEARTSRITYCERQRPMYSLRNVDIKRRIQDLVNYLEIN